MNINNISSGTQSMPKASVHAKVDVHEKTPELFSSGGDNEDGDKLMEQSIEEANKKLKASNRYIEREIHEKTRTVMYKLKDSITGEVIEEFPPKKFQDMLAKIWEIAGLFVDEKA